MEKDGKIHWSFARSNGVIQFAIYDQKDKILALIPFKKILLFYKLFK